MATPAPGGPRKKRRFGGVLAIVLVLLVLAGLGGGAFVQLRRTPPPPALRTTLTTVAAKIPGTLKLPWPAKGAAELYIDGIGTMGGSKASVSAPIGSVAKVMTAYIVLKDHPLTDGQDGPGIMVTVGDVADYNRRLPMGQSLVKVAAGETLTERDALEALMLPSANNVARILAVWDAGSEQAFLTKMNATAQELGMSAGTKYTDPSGFLPTTVSTAHDQVLLGKAAVADPTFSAIVALQHATIPVQGDIKNYNDMLGVEGVFGIKTGSTDQAGGNLLFASHLTIGGKTLTVVGTVFSQPGANTPQQLAQVNKVVKKLLVALRTAAKAVQVVPAGVVGRLTTAWGSDSDVRNDKAVSAVGFPGQTVKITLDRTDVAKLPQGAVPAGTDVGDVKVTGPFGSQTADLLTTAPIDKPSTWWELTRKPGAGTVS